MSILGLRLAEIILVQFGFYEGVKVRFLHFSVRRRGRRGQGPGQHDPHLGRRKRPQPMPQVQRKSLRGRKDDLQPRRVPQELLQVPGLPPGSGSGSGL